MPGRIRAVCKEELVARTEERSVTGRWVIISTDRAKRPSDFLRESVKIQGSAFCPFCYGNEVKDSARNSGLRPHERRSELPWMERSRGPQ